MSEEAVIGAAKAEPLFKLDLGANGGTFAPTTFEELIRWIEQETHSSHWLRSRLPEGHSAKGLLTQLQMARTKANRAASFSAAGVPEFEHELHECVERLNAVFVVGKFPHSTSPLARRIEAFRQDVGEEAAGYFATMLVAADEGSVNIQPRSPLAWRGVVEAVVERYQASSAAASASENAARSAFEDLRSRAEQLVGEKTLAYDSLHRSYDGLNSSIRADVAQQASDFETAQSDRSRTFSDLVGEHAAAMEGLRKTFKEELSLRAPADYWKSKGDGHRLWGWITGSLTFAGIAAAGLYLGVQIHDVLSGTPKGTAPESWRVATLALVGVFSVWGLRLLVRMFLSHLHLLTDARERVVMVKTYLALVEGDQLSSKEDRQLVLQALFRPASDGIVKDEALPFSLAEALTRPGK